MTNREIAERILSRLFHLMSDERESLVNKIEKALNEAEERGFNKAKSKCFDLVNQHCGYIHSNIIAFEDLRDRIESLQPDLEENDAKL